MERVRRDNKFKFTTLALASLILLTIGGTSWALHAAEESSVTSEKVEGEKAAEAKSVGGEEPCCKAGDQTPPIELAKKIPPGGLHSPYQDYAKLAKEGNW
jgi:hypothetical protein